MRQLTPTLFKELQEGSLAPLLEYVKTDDTLDLEFRGNSFTIYYRGGALLTVKETSEGKYSWEGVTKEYLTTSKAKYDQKHKDAKNYEEYIPEAKHILDRYICLSPKNHLGEKEIQQLVVKENNYSPNSQDTDYFIVDMEYEEGQNEDKYRFDLIALRWDSTGTARKKNVVSLAVIEVKQGYKSVRTSASSPGLKSHTEDFNTFVKKKIAEGNLKEFCDDMAMIFKQKCELGLITANEKIEGIKQDFPLSVASNIDFICLLANYKNASDNLRNELSEMDCCRFIRSHHMGYGLYADEIFTLTYKDFK